MQTKDDLRMKPMTSAVLIMTLKAIIQPFRRKDRLGWKKATVAILKMKTPEEMQGIFMKP